MYIHTYIYIYTYIYAYIIFLPFVFRWVAQSQLNVAVGPLHSLLWLSFILIDFQQHLSQRNCKWSFMPVNLFSTWSGIHLTKRWILLQLFGGGNEIWHKPLKNDVWKMSFLLGLPIFRDYVKFQGCTSIWGRWTHFWGAYFFQMGCETTK